MFLKKNDPELVAKIKAHPSVFAIVPVGAAMDGITHVAVANPRFEFGRVVARFFKKPVDAGIASTAVIDPSARLGKHVGVGQYSVIGANVVIGDNTQLRNHVTIAANVTIGRDCLIKSGAVIGEEGFGFEKDENGTPIRIHHVGGVTIGDRVEIGALTSVCCGTIDDTEIGDDTKIDDHVFIAHNVKIGKNCIVIAASEVSGSVVIGDDAWLAPSVTVINGVEIGKGALLGTGAVITKPVEPNAVMGGARATFLRYNDIKKS